jgi:hypothetical protein
MQDKGTLAVHVKGSPKEIERVESPSRDFHDSQVFEEEPEEAPDADAQEGRTTQTESKAQVVAENAYELLYERESAYGQHGYPFRLDDNGDCITLNKRVVGSCYLFLLALSYYDPTTRSRMHRVSGAELFEQICVVATNRLFPAYDAEPDQTVTFHLGVPSVTDLPSNFSKKVQCICRLIREGRGYKVPPSGCARSSGDDGVDILHRRGFPDSRGAQFLTFASCASGRTDWLKKRNECNPRAWCEEHMLEIPFAPNAMSQLCYLPRVIPRDRWSSHSRRAGAVVDRCRLTLLLKDLRPIKRDCEAWLLTFVVPGKSLGR